MDLRPLFLCLFGLLMDAGQSPPAKAASQLPIIVNGPRQEKPPAKWNSHIDNATYLEHLRRQRQTQLTAPSPVLRVEKSFSGPLSRKRHPHSSPESWEIEYHTPGYSLIYRENYRLNEVPRTIIVPPRREYPSHPIRPTNRHPVRQRPAR